ncbi:MAG: GNAT family N-acetyltransferase [Aureispira sp.]|nr:GNAT family N-acetyltransferase [Aureispira sp.]
MNSSISVRPLKQEDIPLIANYWVNSPSDHMQAMGVDLNKRPSAEDFSRALTGQLALPIEKRQAYCLIWELDGQPIGHSNTNPTQYGESAYMHLHIWTPEHRKNGLGKQFLKLSIQGFFEDLQLQTLYCQPYALNPAPNRTLEKVGFTFLKEYITIPGSINFEQPVKLWELTKANYQQLFNNA